ncbi:MAG: hypothetical protein J5881_05290 [Clostridia bacterium]|nr:hypothetical protein [Clostridia bacterium]
MYYIEETDKPYGGFTKIFPKVNLKENIISIDGLSEEVKEKKTIKMAQKTDKILKKSKSNKIVLSKNGQKNEVFKNMLFTYGYDIVEGKWLFEGLSSHVIDYIVKKKNIKKEESYISVLVNELSDYTLQNIKKFANEFKSLNIVTNHIDKFKKIEKQILDESGLIVTITNNKKKSLLKSKIILNIDFPNETINKYNIKEDAIIISILKNIKINKKRFNGLVVNNYEIKVNDDVLDANIIKSIDKYYTAQAYEASFYKKMTFADFSKKIKKDGCEINRLYSINGVL